VLNLDNGPESHSHRTQFMFRLVQFVQRTGVAVRLAYYPPYHSKYNPIERCWGILEMHWNGALLDSREAVCRFTASMTWKGSPPHRGVGHDPRPQRCHPHQRGHGRRRSPSLPPAAPGQVLHRHFLVPSLSPGDLAFAASLSWRSQ